MEKRSALTILFTLFPSLIAALVIMAVASSWISAPDTGVIIIMAILTYLLFRLLYPAVTDLFPLSLSCATVHWEVTNEMLILNGKRIPRTCIREIYCWPNRDALGHSLDGWTVNIEAEGEHHILLRSVTRGQEASRSAKGLETLVRALGFRWPEETERKI